MGTTRGRIELDGKAVEFSSLRASDEAGVVLVPQELHVVPHLTIAENMFAGRLPGQRGLYDERKAVNDAREALGGLRPAGRPEGSSLDVDPVGAAAGGACRSLHRSARVLILDEPTAALTDSEATVLLEQLRRFRRAGVGIIYITHRLDELRQLADDVMVLRNGRLVAEFDSVPAQGELVSAMLGETYSAIQEIAAPRAIRVGRCRAGAARGEPVGLRR